MPIPSAIALAMHVEMSLVFTAVPPPTVTVAPIADGDRDMAFRPRRLLSPKVAPPEAGNALALETTPERRNRVKTKSNGFTY